MRRSCPTGRGLAADAAAAPAIRPGTTEGCGADRPYPRSGGAAGGTVFVFVTQRWCDTGADQMVFRS